MLRPGFLLRKRLAVLYNYIIYFYCKAQARRLRQRRDANMSQVLISRKHLYMYCLRMKKKMYW